jgi:hypothetical protein
MCFIPVPFDPKAVFGKVRAPVKVTVGSYTFRTTIFTMGGVTGVPLRKSNREAAGLEGTETTEIRLELDEEPRVVEAPADLKRALKAAKVTAAWEALSYSHQREHVEAIEGAKAPETRWRRIAAALVMLGAPAPKETKPRVKAKKAKTKPKTTAKTKPKAKAKKPRAESTKARR